MCVCVCVYVYVYMYILLSSEGWPGREYTHASQPGSYSNDIRAPLPHIFVPHVYPVTSVPSCKDMYGI